MLILQGYKSKSKSNRIILGTMWNNGINVNHSISVIVEYFKTRSHGGLYGIQSNCSHDAIALICTSIIKQSLIL